MYSPINPRKINCSPAKKTIVVTIELYPIGVDGSKNFSRKIKIPYKPLTIAIINPVKENK